MIEGAVVSDCKAEGRDTGGRAAQALWLGQGIVQRCSLVCWSCQHRRTSRELTTLLSVRIMTTVLPIRASH